jgi:hypothetical protein
LWNILWQIFFVVRLVRGRDEVEDLVQLDEEAGLQIVAGVDFITSVSAVISGRWLNLSSIAILYGLKINKPFTILYCP